MCIVLPEPRNNQQATLFKRHHQAVFTELDGQTALFQADTCDYLVLNETGSAIWLLLESPRSMQAICRQLVEDYDIDHETCLRETEDWLNAAVEKKVAIKTTD